MLLDEFLSPDQYVKDATVREHSSERVEYAIKFRLAGDGDELLLPVDAKFPREDYERLIEASEAGDTQLVAHFRKQLENRIKGCAKDIRDKYINPPRTTEFGILFIPAESLYAEVLRQPGLFEYLQRECRVTLAGPTTFAAVLHAFQMNFRSLAIAQRSSEVWNILSAVRTEFGRYNDVVERIGKQLNSAATSVETLGRRTRAMNRKLKAVEALPDQSTADEILGLGNDQATIDDDEGVGGQQPQPVSYEGVVRPLTSETPQTSSPAPAH
jgi:DNA recombination protein RmuC